LISASASAGSATSIMRTSRSVAWALSFSRMPDISHGLCLAICWLNSSLIDASEAMAAPSVPSIPNASIPPTSIADSWFGEIHRSVSAGSSHCTSPTSRKTGGDAFDCR